MSGDTLNQRMTLALAGINGLARLPDQEGNPGTPFDAVRMPMGLLTLPTGRICVNDGFLSESHPPLTIIVPPGSYPTEMVIARMAPGPWGGDRGAFVVVTFSQEPIVTWTAITAIVPAAPSYTDEKPNRIVQEGMTALFSPEAGQPHFASVRTDFHGLRQRVRNEQQGPKACSWMSYTPEGSSANVLLCHGGFGDGDVAVYAGLAQHGRMARLVLDFDVAT